MNVIEFRLKFEVQAATNGATVPLKTQRCLLLPFQKLRGAGQKCSIGGCVDDELADQVRTKMMPTVLWQRVQVREYIELQKKRKSFADNVFSSAMIAPYSKGEPPSKCLALYRLYVAHTLYNDLMTCTLTSTGMMRAISGEVDDTTFGEEYSSYVHRVKINLLLVKLLIAEQEVEDVATKHFTQIINSTTVMEGVPETDRLRSSLYDIILAMATFTVEDYERAQHFFDCAFSKDNESKLAKLGGYWCDNRIFYKTSPMEPRSTPADDMRDFMELLPRKPFMEPDTEPISTLASLDEDLYILELLGYDGDLLEGRVRQKHGYSLNHADGEEVNRPFDQAQTKRRLACVLRDRANCQQQGRRVPLFEVNTHIINGAPPAIDIPGLAFAPHAWGDTYGDVFSISNAQMQAAALVFGPLDVHGIPEGMMQIVNQLSGFQSGFQSSFQ